ncbi:hypothetical protein ONZ45_g12387 [Pleurotus djamor]|nr:hypothetical protein ONZ45_g12387 [Pleurotus djamor]
MSIPPARFSRFGPQSRYVAGIAFLLWDIGITTSQEVELVWGQPFIPMNLVYVFIRYVPVLVRISTWPIGSTASPGVNFTAAQCTIWEAYEFGFAMITMSCVEFILLLRVAALYYNQKLIANTIKVMYIIEVICMIVGFGLTVPNYEFDPVCTVTKTPSTIILYGAVTPIFQTVLFILTVVKFAHTVKSGWGRIPILDMMMRDSTWAFFVIEGVIFANAIPFFAATEFSLFGWMQCTFSFVGYRVILNMRSLSKKSACAAETRDVESHLVFASGSFGE